MNESVTEFELTLPDTERRSNPSGRKRKHFERDNNFINKIDTFGLYLLKSWAGRISILSLMLICIIALCFSYYFRLDILDESNELSVQRQSLQTQIQDIQLVWETSDLQKIDEQVDDMSSHIISGYSGLASWLSRHTEKANQLGLQLNYLMSDAIPIVAIKNVMEIPVSITLKHQAHRADKGYTRSLEFLHMLLQEQWRLDFTSIRMESNGNGVESVSARINFWVRSQTEHEGTTKMASTENNNE